MPSQIQLTVTEGPLQGQQFTFDERATCIVGRADDCQPRLPSDEHHKTISRHHCLLDINPPEIRVRDFGSLNGTFVNNQKIGQRDAHMSPEEGAQLEMPEHDLKDGHELKLGDTVLRVGIFVPATCTDCGAEIPERNVYGVAGAAYRCANCQRRAEQAGRPAPPRPKPRVCARCGRDVAGEVADNRPGEVVCAACQNDPMQILQMLLQQAMQGDAELTSIRGYSVLEELGRGGFGAVYLARHERSGEPVALKVMLPRVAADKKSKDLFLREIENTKALQHRNVVQLHEGGCSDGTFYFTLEYCDSGSVDKLMDRRGGKLAVAEAAPLILQALDGLIYAHAAEIPHVKLKDGSIGRGRGLVHRDLKPHNIFLSGAGSDRIAKIGDYGLSKAFDTAGLSGLTRSGTAMGTPSFAPRQQVINFKYARPEVDVWAMAASLYFMLTGYVPRDFPKHSDPWKVVLESNAVPIRKRDRAIPRRLADVIDAALVDKPTIGCQSAAEFKRALESAL